MAVWVLALCALRFALCAAAAGYDTVCPRCNQGRTCAARGVVTVSEEPATREKVLSHQLVELECPICDLAFTAEAEAFVDLRTWFGERPHAVLVQSPRSKVQSPALVQSAKSKVQSPEAERTSAVLLRLGPGVLRTPKDAEAETRVLGLDPVTNQPPMAVIDWWVTPGPALVPVDPALTNRVATWWLSELGSLRWQHAWVFGRTYETQFRLLRGEPGWWVYTHVTHSDTNDHNPWLTGWAPIYTEEPGRLFRVMSN